MALVLAAVEARADPRPIRIDYEAHPGCPGREVFLEELVWRTSAAREAAPGERGLRVEARITRQRGASVGRLTLDDAAAPLQRSIEGESCDEVVSALALVTALFLDPHARTGRRPSSPVAPQAPVPPAAPEASPPSPLVAARGSLAGRLAGSAPDILPLPLPAALASPAPGGPPGSWSLGARATAALAVTPSALFGGEIFAARRFAGALGASLEAAVDLSGTGDIAVRGGEAWFLQAIGRIEGCPVRVRFGGRWAFAPCVEVEAGVLRGQGVLQSPLTYVDAASVPWAGAGLLPRLEVGFGPLALEVRGGPVFPLVRQEFVFKTPFSDVYDVPAVTATVSAGLGVRFP